MTAPRLCATGADCGRPAHHDLTICVHCTWTLEQALAAVPDLVLELETANTGLGTNWPDGPGGSSAVARLPFNVRAAAAATALHDTLDTWTARLLERAIAGRSRPMHTAGLARWLEHHLPDLVRRPDAARAVADITRTVDRGWHTVDRPAGRDYAGTCDCGTELYAQPGNPHVTCPTCDTTHDTEARRDRMRDDLDGRLLTGAEIARLAQYFGRCDRERARNLIKVWATRGVITAHGHTRAGDPLYPFGPTLRLLTERAPARTG